MCVCVCVYTQAAEMPDMLVSAGCSWLGCLSPQQCPVKSDSQAAHRERQGTKGRGWVGLVAFLCYNKEPDKMGLLPPVSLGPLFTTNGFQGGSTGGVFMQIQSVTMHVMLHFKMCFNMHMQLK